MMEMITAVVQIIIIILFVAWLVRYLFQRNMPRVGGKIGPRRRILPAAPIPEGFSSVHARVMTLFVAASDAARFSSLKSFLRHGTVRHASLMRIYRVAGCKTQIEIRAECPDYERIDAAEALALLRELPDPRFIRRLQLSDELSHLDPWVRRIAGSKFFLAGVANSAGLIVLYKPDRHQGRSLGLTLLHEWLHLVAFKSTRHIRRFKRASAIEPLLPAPIERVSFGDRNTEIYEAWCDLGEKLFGYDDTIARAVALALPVHAMILWQRVERIMRKAPARLRSTRFAEFEMRAAFMRGEVASKARVA